MPELTTMEKPKTAGFVDRGFNYAKKQKRIEEEEAEIARLEAEARGEEVAESESSGENTEDTQVQATDVMVTCVGICKKKKKSGIND